MISALLNKKILIQKGADTTSAVLSPDIEFTDYMETWANVYVRSGETRFNESEELWFTTEFTIRYTNKSKLINNKYRIKYNDQYYRIIEIIEKEPRQSITIIAQHFYSD